MTRWDSAISAQAWDRLMQRYQDLGGEDADDHDLAELLRQMVFEVEG